MITQLIEYEDAWDESWGVIYECVTLKVPMGAFPAGLTFDWAEVREAKGTLKLGNGHGEQAKTLARFRLKLTAEPLPERSGVARGD